MGKLVWLASYPKSGNTWVRAFLHNYITGADTPYSINALADFCAVESTASFFHPHDPRPASAYTTQDVQRLRPAVHEDLTRLHDDLVFVKTHNAALAVHNIPLCTPSVTAGAIYLVRDPRDIAISYAAHTGQSIDQIIAFMASKGAANRGTDTQVFEFLGSWSTHVESWAANRKNLVIRYEDLLATPQSAFGKIITYLGEPPGPTRLTRAITNSNFETLSAQELLAGYAAASPHAKSPFFRQGRAGHWQSTLTPAQSRQIKSTHRAMMQRFGYL
jgi:hypothetical protein